MSDGLIRFGRRAEPSEGVVPLLTECHERIRRFVGHARTAAERALPDEEVVALCDGVERYFRQALPLHVCDEEESVAPRLRGRSGELDATLDAIEAEHADHDALVKAMLEALAAVRAAPGDAANKALLSASATALQAELEGHLAREEADVFPAIAALPSEEQASIVRELRERRRA